MGFFQDLFGTPRPRKDANLGIRPSDRVEAEEEEEEDSDEDSMHFIDGEIVFGHMECTDKECGWTGDISDASQSELLEVTKHLSGKYEGSYITREVSGEYLQKVSVHECPDCGSTKLKFIEKVK